MLPTSTFAWQASRRSLRILRTCAWYGVITPMFLASVGSRWAAPACPGSTAPASSATAASWSSTSSGPRSRTSSGCVTGTFPSPIQELYRYLIILQRDQPTLWDAFVNAYVRTAIEVRSSVIFTFMDNVVYSRILMPKRGRSQRSGFEPSSTTGAADVRQRCQRVLVKFTLHISASGHRERRRHLGTFGRLKCQDN